MSPTPKDVIDTVRLHLRRGHLSDAPAIAAGLGDWAVSQWLINPPYPYMLGDAENFLRHADPSPPFLTGQYLITLRGTGDVIGCVGLRPGADALWELTYWLNAARHGHGYMSEAATAYVDAATTHAPERRLFATTDPENIGSQKVLHRCGFVLMEERTRPQPTRRGATKAFYFERRARPGAD